MLTSYQPEAVWLFSSNPWHQHDNFPWQTLEMVVWEHFHEGPTTIACSTYWCSVCTIIIGLDHAYVRKLIELLACVWLIGCIWLSYLQRKHCVTVLKESEIHLIMVQPCLVLGPVLLFYHIIHRVKKTEKESFGKSAWQEQSETKWCHCFFFPFLITPFKHNGSDTAGFIFVPLIWHSCPWFSIDFGLGSLQHHHKVTWEIFKKGFFKVSQVKWGNHNNRSIHFHSFFHTVAWSKQLTWSFGLFCLWFLALVNTNMLWQLTSDVLAFTLCAISTAFSLGGYLPLSWHLFCSLPLRSSIFLSTAPFHLSLPLSRRMSLALLADSGRLQQGPGARSQAAFL